MGSSGGPTGNALPRCSGGSGRGGRHCWSVKTELKSERGGSARAARMNWGEAKLCCVLLNDALSREKRVAHCWAGVAQLLRTQQAWLVVQQHNRVQAQGRRAEGGGGTRQGATGAAAHLAAVPGCLPTGTERARARQSHAGQKRARFCKPASLLRGGVLCQQACHAAGHRGAPPLCLLSVGGAAGVRGCGCGREPGR